MDIFVLELLCITCVYRLPSYEVIDGKLELWRLLGRSNESNT